MLDFILSAIMRRFTIGQTWCVLGALLILFWVALVYAVRLALVPFGV